MARPAYGARQGRSKFQDLDRAVTAPLFAQRQQPNPAKLKADAQRVVSIFKLRAVGLAQLDLLKLRFLRLGFLTAARNRGVILGS